MKKLATVLLILTFAFILAGQHVSAASTVNITVNQAYAKANNTYDVVVKDTPGAKLALYVNDKNPSRATTNKKDWATFHKVKLAGSGKISFTSQLKGSNGKTYEKPINYVRYYQVAPNGVTFFASDPNKVASPSPALAPVATPMPVQAPAPAPTPAPVPKTVCTNGTYVNSVGNTVCSPEASPSAPAGATARCVDGTYSFSQSRSGTCSHHGGVAAWL